MYRYIQQTLHPAWYHGHRAQPPFFEGWYFKLIDAEQKHRYAVIPGIFKNADPAKAHAFVQVLDGLTGTSAYYSFPSDQFWAAPNEFEVHIGRNRFRADSLQLDLKGEGIDLVGQLRFEGGIAYPVSLLSPGIMGWYGWIPIMECYHGLVSLDHRINGELQINNQRADFTGGRGYLEKDWGQSFPSAWVWMQTNHFEQAGPSLSASIAQIPFLGRTFPGYIVVFWDGQKLHRFTTYTGAKVDKLEVTDKHVHWALSNRDSRLDLVATRTAGGLLHSPSRTQMHKRVMETLQATVEVCLLPEQGGKPIFSGTGACAGLEVQGDINLLQSK
jgi:tocopherol cyclase